jgi:GNAT superfamily N-acetyltransferase
VHSPFQRLASNPPMISRATYWAMLKWTWHQYHPMEGIVWLKQMFRQELDLRPPSLAKIGENSVLIYDEAGNPIAHAALSNRWSSSEINSVIVDPNHRGRGLTHKLLEQFGGGRLFSYTRDVRLQSTLLKAGFERMLYPGLLTLLNIGISRIAIFFWMIVALEFRRIFHQFRHLLNYKLFIRP